MFNLKAFREANRERRERFTIARKYPSQGPAIDNITISKKRDAVTKIVKLLSNTIIEDGPTEYVTVGPQKFIKESQHSRSERSFYAKIKPSTLTDQEIGELFTGLKTTFLK